MRDRIRGRSGPEAAERLQPDRLVNSASIAEVYWQLHQQPRDCWTHELDIRPYCEPW